MWIITSVVLVILVSIIWVLTRAKYTPEQEQARAHVIAAFGLDGGLIFHTIMVLSGPDKHTRNEQSKKMIAVYGMGHQAGMEFTKECIADLCNHYMENPQKINRSQSVALKMCVQHNILEKMMRKEAA